jgi:hypothetical protein
VSRHPVNTTCDADAREGADVELKAGASPMPPMSSAAVPMVATPRRWFNHVSEDITG